METKKYFGTSGVRGTWGKDLTPELVEHYANAVVKFGAKKIVMGCDTRTSCNEIMLGLYRVFGENGIKVINLGVVPVASVSFLTKQGKADMGLMVSASHNPADQNGIKPFDKNGENMSGADLEKLENLLQNEVQKPSTQGDAIELWRDTLIKKFTPIFNGKDLPKIAVDFANGSGAGVAQYVFNALGFDLSAYNTETNGINVNNNCGATHPENLSKAIKKSKNKPAVSFAFDGDADRCVALDECGEEVLPERLFGAIALHNKCTQAVFTRMANTGMVRYLADKGITLTLTDIGERFVIAGVRELEKKGVKNVIGGEQSSHYIFPDIIYNGDALVTALKTLAMVVETGMTLRALTQSIPMWPSILHNTPLDVPGGETKYDDARVFVRKSGTEKLTRVFIEAQTQKRVDELLAQILKK